MTKSDDLKLFVERIMNMRVLKMNGALSYLGQSNDDILNNLKRAAIEFASEYRKTDQDQDKLSRLSNEMYGYIQTLQLTYTLSEKEAKDLIAQLDSFDD